MESDLKKKIQEKLLSYEKGWRGMEWTDLIAWMQDLKYLIEKSNKSIFDTQTAIDISKRLSLCLNPSLPQGIHLKALEIYSILLKLQKSSQFLIFLFGFLSYFPHSSGQAKQKFIEIIKELPKSHDIIEPIIFSLLQGTEEKGENFIMINEIIDKLLEESFKITYTSLWKFLLKSRKNKNSALIILRNKAFDKDLTSLAINGILAGLADENIRVKRHSLDILKKIFPVNDKICEYEEYLLLIKFILIELNSRDSSLCRRLWEWIFPIDLENLEIPIKLITDAFLQLASEENQKDLVIRTAELIMQSEYNHEVFGIIGLNILEYCAVNSVIFENCCETIKNIFYGHESQLFKKFVDESNKIFEHSQDTWINMLDFMVKYKIYDKDFAFESVQFIMTHYEHIKNKLKFMQTSVDLSVIIEKLPDTSNLCAVLYDLIIDENEKELTHKIGTLLINFAVIGLDTTEILLDLKLKISHVKDTNFFNIMFFISRFNNGPISLSELKYIWKKILTSEKAYSLIIKFSEKNLEILHSSFLEVMTSSALGISIFLKFWQKSSMDQIKTIINDSVISIIINSIDSNDDLKAWIHTIEEKSFLVVDFIIVLLLDLSTLRMHANGIFVYQQIFSIVTQASRLRTLKIFLAHINHIAIESLMSMPLTQKSEILMAKHGLQAKNYVQGITKILILYLKTQPFNQLTEYSIDCLELISKNFSVNLCYLLIKNSFSVLEHAIAQENVSLQLQILNVNVPILQKLSVKYYIKLCNSNFFTNCLLQGCFSIEASLRSVWQNVVISTFGLILQYSQQSGLFHYVSALLTGSHHFMLQFKEFSMLPVIKNTILMTLGMDVKDNFSQTQISIGIKLLETVIRISSDAWTIANEKSLNNYIVKELENIFFPIAIKYTFEIIEAFLSIWTKFCQLKKGSIYSLLSILPCFQLSIETIIDNLQVLALNKEKKNTDKDVYITYFLYCLLENYQSIKLPVLSHQILWYKTINIVKILSKSACMEVHPLLLKTFGILQRYSVSVYSYSDASLKKEIREIIGKLQENVCSDLLRTDKMCISLPYPDIDSEVKIHEICLKYMIKHSYSICHFACLGDIAFCGLYISNVCLSLLFALPSALIGKELATEFVLNSLLIPGLKVAEKIKNEVISLVISDNFFLRCKECLGNIGKILNEIAKQCYCEKHGIITEVLGLYSKGWVKAQKNQEKFKKCILRIGFIMFCGEKDEYLCSFYTVQNYLKECFKIPDLLNVFLLLLKILIIRINKENFSELWNKFMPDLHIIMIETIEKSYNYDKILDILRFFEYMLMNQYEETYKILFGFAADVPEVEESCENQKCFSPVVIQRFVENLKLKVKWNKKGYPQLKVKESAMLGIEKVKNFEEIEIIAKSFIQFCLFYSSQTPSQDLKILEANIEEEFTKIY